MLTSEVHVAQPPPITSKDLKDLDQALKKQLKTLKADFEKSQTDLLEKLKEAVRYELRREPTYVEEEPLFSSIMDDSRFDSNNPVSVNDAPTNPVAIPRKKEGRVVPKRKGGRTSMNPFKHRNAKLNDADDLDSPQRRTVLLIQAQTLMQQALGAGRDSMMSNKAITNEPSMKRQGTITDPAGQEDGTVRGLQLVQDAERPAESSDVAVSLARAATIRDEEVLGGADVGTDLITSRSSVHQNEPLLKAQGSVQFSDAEEPSFDYIALLYNPALEGAIVCLVILNALWIGVELEYKLAVSEIRPFFFQWIDILFCALFLCELMFRIFVLRVEFFDPRMPNWTWNVFDSLLVLSQTLEIIFWYVDVHKRVNISWLRILRVLRIVRLTRIVRAVRFIEGLRTLMKCVLRGMKATGWITLFLMMQIYTCSLAFTEVVHEIRENYNLHYKSSADLEVRFGRLTSTMGTLCKSIMGGITWDTALSPLEEVSVPLGFAFVLYVCFSMFVILNIVTGFFVNTSSLCADEDHKKNLRDHVADIFVQDTENTYLNSVDERIFTERVNSPEMQSYFQSIDLHVEEAEGLFKLLDLDGNGTLDPIECVSALIRMQGSAKALDLRIMMFMFTKAHEWNIERMSVLEERIGSVHDILTSKPNGAEQASGSDSKDDAPMQATASDAVRQASRLSGK